MIVNTMTMEDSEANSGKDQTEAFEPPKNRFGIPYLLATDKEEKDMPKKEVLNVLGLQLSAPAGMQNPLLIFFGLIGVNIAIIGYFTYMLNK